MDRKGLVNAVLVVLAVSLVGLAGCATPVKGAVQSTPPTQAPTPIPSLTPTKEAVQSAPPTQAPTPIPSLTPTAEADTAVEYRNTQYGLYFPLPVSWKGYTAIVDKWSGYKVDQPQGEAPAEQGPQILIRHPKWTSQVPRQDIPIMVFTLKQWDALVRGEFHIGAAPINPSELGRNASYVFALPARYNYAYPEGWEEVEQILKGKPLKTFEPS